MNRSKSSISAGLALALGALAPLPSAAQVAAAPATATAPAALSTAETTIGALLEKPTTKAVVDKHIPGLSGNAQIGMASGMTLRAIQPMAGNMITTDMLDAIDADLAKLPAK